MFECNVHECFSINFKQAIKLSVFAIFFLAISNAGPWSGDTLKIGSPPVTLTELKKSRVLTGDSP